MSQLVVRRRSFIRTLVGLGLSSTVYQQAARGEEKQQDSSPVALLKQRFVGRETQVLVLGTPHLVGTPKSFTLPMLEPLLSRLQTFAPTAICIEALSGASIAALQAYPQKYADTLSEFAGLSLKFRTLGMAATKLSLEEAEQNAAKLLGKQGRSSAENRRLTACFASTGDPWSALLQWRRLPAEERRSTDQITPELVQALDTLNSGRNENQWIGVTLANRLGLERLWSVDDHSADDLLDPIADALGAYLTTPGLINTLELAKISGVAQELTSPDTVLPTYLKVNSLEYGRRDAEVEWRVFIDKLTPGDMGRIRIAEWEIRNVRMVANIRRASASIAGGKLLVVVGADHKAWFERYLGMMCDLTIVNAATVLGPI